MSDSITLYGRLELARPARWRDYRDLIGDFADGPANPGATMLMAAESVIAEDSDDGPLTRRQLIGFVPRTGDRFGKGYHLENEMAQLCAIVHQLDAEITGHLFTEYDGGRPGVARWWIDPRRDRIGAPQWHSETAVLIWPDGEIAVDPDSGGYVVGEFAYQSMGVMQ